MDDSHGMLLDVKLDLKDVRSDALKVCVECDNSKMKNRFFFSFWRWKFVQVISNVFKKKSFSSEIYYSFDRIGWIGWNATLKSMQSSVFLVTWKLVFITKMTYKIHSASFGSIYQACESVQLHRAPNHLLMAFFGKTTENDVGCSLHSKTNNHAMNTWHISKDPSIRWSIIEKVLFFTSISISLFFMCSDRISKKKINKMKLLKLIEWTNYFYRNFGKSSYQSINKWDQYRRISIRLYKT